MSTPLPSTYADNTSHFSCIPENELCFRNQLFHWVVAADPSINKVLL